MNQRESDLIFAEAARILKLGYISKKGTADPKHPPVLNSHGQHDAENEELVTNPLVLLVSVFFFLQLFGQGVALALAPP